jgi:signal peptidase I
MTKRSRHTGKIGWCNSNALKLRKGHFVLIRRVKGLRCDVNTFSAIEDHSKNIEIPKVKLIKRGALYPIPTSDINLPRFSGLDKRVIKNVKLSDIKQKDKYRIKNRHIHYINRYMK